MYRHFGRDGPIRIIRQILDNRIIEREFALLRELRYGNAGERFINGTEVELGINAIGRVSAFVRKAVSLFENGLTVFRDQYSARECVLGNGSLHVSLGL